jgi:hypothetical protein
MKKTMITQGKRAKKKVMTPEDIMTSRYYISKDISTYNKICLIRGIAGVVCIGVGVATWLVPFTTIPLITLGAYLLGYNAKVMFKYAKFQSKKIIDWVYCNRSLSRIKRTFRARFLQ